MKTIYREQGEYGDLRDSRTHTYCHHSHRTPQAAGRCPQTHGALAPAGMRTTATIMASDDGGKNFRPLRWDEGDALGC